MFILFRKNKKKKKEKPLSDEEWEKRKKYIMQLQKEIQNIKCDRICHSKYQFGYNYTELSNILIKNVPENYDLKLKWKQIIQHFTYNVHEDTIPCVIVTNTFNKLLF